MRLANQENEFPLMSAHPTSLFPTIRPGARDEFHSDNAPPSGVAFVGKDFYINRPRNSFKALSQGVACMQTFFTLTTKDSAVIAQRRVCGRPVCIFYSFAIGLAFIYIFNERIWAKPTANFLRPRVHPTCPIVKARRLWLTLRRQTVASDSSRKYR